MGLSFEVVWALAIVKAWKEPAFKAELLNNPKQALQTHFNYTLHKDIDLVVKEGQPGQPVRHTLTLPPKPATLDITDPAALAIIMEVGAC